MLMKSLVRHRYFSVSLQQLFRHRHSGIVVCPVSWSWINPLVPSYDCYNKRKGRANRVLKSTSQNRTKKYFVKSIWNKEQLRNENCILLPIMIVTTKEKDAPIAS
jgi:hypothetical protein